MARKITIGIIETLLFASVFFTLVSPLIPIALDIDFENWGKIIGTLFIFGVIMSFVFSTILTLICDFWKEKTKEK